MDGAAGSMHSTAGYKVENSENSVCPRPLHKFLQFFFQFLQFRSVRLHQVTSDYIILRQFTLEGRDLELDKKTGTR